MSSRMIWRIKNLCSKDKFARASSSIGAGRSGTPELFFQSCVANSPDRIRKERPRRKTDVWGTRLLTGLESYEINGTDARVAGKLKSSWARKGRTLTLDDAIIAAITIERGCALVTDNRKDFPMPEVQLYPLP